MVVTDQHRPVLAHLAYYPKLRWILFVELLHRFGPSEHKGTRIDRMLQRPQEHVIQRLDPDGRMRTQLSPAHWEPKPFLDPPYKDLSGRTQFIELLKKRPKGMSYGFVASQYEVTQIVNVIACWRDGDDLSTADFVPSALHHTLDRGIKFHFAHLTTEPQHHAVGTAGLIVDRSFVSDERVGPAAHVDQIMPIRIVASKPHHLQGQNDSHVSTADRSYESGKTASRLGCCAALALVLIHKNVSFLRPAGFKRPVRDRRAATSSEISRRLSIVNIVSWDGSSCDFESPSAFVHSRGIFKLVPFNSRTTITFTLDIKTSNLLPLRGWCLRVIVT